MTRWPYLSSMQGSIAVAVCLAAGSLCLAEAAEHSYTREERYAGCLFGDTVPLLRKGYERNRALSIASSHCASLSTELSAREIEKISDFVNFSIDMWER